MSTLAQPTLQDDDEAAQASEVLRAYQRQKRGRRYCKTCCALAVLLLAAAVGVQAWSFWATSNQLQPATSHPTLRFRPDGTFKLAQFCDMHFGENDAHDKESVEFQWKMLALESPDLVVIDGDALSNYAAPPCTLQLSCQNFFREQWLKFTEVFRLAHVPYAYALGNHDRIPGHLAQADDGWERGYAVTDHSIMEMDSAYHTMSLAEDGPKAIHGASNYVVPILGPDDKPAFYIWLLDSSDNDCLGVQGWGCVYPDQVEWYRRTSARLIERDGRTVPGLMFHHIPLPEVLDAWNDVDNTEVLGVRNESVCCFSENTGLFDAIREVGNVRGVFHGHDHNNDFIAEYRGVTIGFGRKSGHGGYGGPVADHPGSRMFEVRLGGDDQNVSWETWIRLETGERLVQEKAPASWRRAEEDQLAQCCGKAGSSAESAALFDGELGADGELELISAAIHACRVHDDVHMCRVATGVSAPAAPFGTA